MITSMVRGYPDPRFCTFKQALDNGWSVRNGEKGSRIEYWEPKLGKKDEEGATDEEKKSRSQDGRAIERGNQSAPSDSARLHGNTGPQASSNSHRAYSEPGK